MMKCRVSPDMAINAEWITFEHPGAVPGVSTTATAAGFHPDQAAMAMTGTN
jgi:hypothetical protein